MDPSSQPEVVQAAISRRNFLRAAGLGATTLAFTSPLLAACSSSKKTAAADVERRAHDGGGSTCLDVRSSDDGGGLDPCARVSSSGPRARAP